MRRRVLLSVTAGIAALGVIAPGVGATGDAPRADGAHAGGLHRDQVQALRMTVDWLAAYPQAVWVGVEMPGACRMLADKRRSCPVSIRLRAWTAGVLVPWQCDARVLLPAPRSSSQPRRTSARCHLLADTDLA